MLIIFLEEEFFCAEEIMAFQKHSQRMFSPSSIQQKSLQSDRNTKRLIQFCNKRKVHISKSVFLLQKNWFMQKTSYCQPTPGRQIVKITLSTRAPCLYMRKYGIPFHGVNTTSHRGSPYKQEFLRCKRKFYFSLRRSFVNAA